ncbi:hypothetical protein [Xanthobacter tagetidis]|uniref:Uncharacterized protein n=1 Tax=Xanthobacter tagetidis TaxID=60216 RepID=A0A3L7ADG4_9HYPH|nr:hypothetical protein [Xanthobacter tagetidis]MBB6309707.1 hypothetical protein [Xanthobacter tagetidis]RLP78257.1 hypothetical protein D9R14_12825 [Xanthobacter tagetidis]
MNEADLKELKKASLALLRLTDAEWRAISGTRRRGEHFSLHFAHKIAREAQRGGLVLVAAPEAELRLGTVTSINATSTFDSRVVFDRLTPIVPVSLEELLAGIARAALKTPRARLEAAGAGFHRISEKLGEAIVDELARKAENGPALARTLAYRRRPRRFDNARALQGDAVALAIKAFGGSSEAAAVSLPGGDTALGFVRLLEDAVIEHDARWMPGWRLSDSDLTGRATFERRGERLDVFTANKRPLEELFGVDLIYLNEARGALVMVQYKMLEPEERGRRRIEFGPYTYDVVDDQEWTVHIDHQFLDELGRMRRFGRDLEPDSAYRLHPGAFFFKFVRRRAAANSAGILLSMGHLEQLMAAGELAGARGGLRLSYRSLDGHYLRSEPFVELVRSGYVGTRGATTKHLQTLIKSSLQGGRAVVAGVQSALDDLRR